MPNSAFPPNLSRPTALCFILAVAGTFPCQAQVSANYQDARTLLAQALETPEEVQMDDLSEPDETRSLVLSESVLSLQGGKKVMAEAGEAINAEKYDQAAEKLQQARKIFNQLSNFHLQLANSFSGIDSKIQESERNSALETGQLRDEATYQLALVHRAQNKPELAVPLLIQVIRSQNPTSQLGKKSYQQLYEIGFVNTPYSPGSPSAPPATPPPTSK